MAASEEAEDDESDDSDENEDEDDDESLCNRVVCLLEGVFLSFNLHQPNYVHYLDLMKKIKFVNFL